VKPRLARLSFISAVSMLGACGSLPRAELWKVLEENPRFSARAAGDAVLLSFSDMSYRIPAEVYSRAIARTTEFDYVIATETDVLRQTLEYIDENKDGIISERELFSVMTSKKGPWMLSSIRDEAEIYYMESHPEKTDGELSDMCDRKYDWKSAGR